MKIKRFVAPDIRQAMRMVREEQGPDAVILSNKRVEEGVEIVAAIDYDEAMLAPAPAALKPAPAPLRAEAPAAAPAPVAMPDPALAAMQAELHRLRRVVEHQLSGLAWGAFVRGEPRRVELIQRLMKLGLNAAHCKAVADAAGADGGIEILWRRALEALARSLPVCERDLLDEGGVVALVGPTGVGKTTTIAKLAARYALRHGSRNVALVTIDNYRVGAHEQLRTYGRLIDVPVRVAEGAEELGAALDELSDRRLVLIDTTGMSQRDSGLVRQAGALESCRTIGKVFLLLSATSRPSALEEVVAAFKGFRPDGCMLTKVDESTCLGGALSVAIKHRLAVAYLSDGQRVPEDLHPARAEGLVARACELMAQSSSLLEEELVALAFGKELADAHV
jgi:flagellar biosynthesis protein FlhF